MSKQWRLALILAFITAMSVFISACGGSSSTGGSTPTATTGAGSTPTTASSTPAAAVTPTGAYNCVQGTINVAGSTALQPLVTDVAKAYQTKCSGANITVNGGGSGTGLTQVLAGQVQIGNSDVFSKPGQEALVDHQVAIVIFAIVVNSKITGVSSLTTDQLKGIYSGQVKSWKEVGGPDVPVVGVTRPASSGTRQTFEKYVLSGKETISGPSNLQTDSTGTVLTNVKQTEGAIGYVTLGAAKGQDGITILKIDNNEPSADTVKNNTYKFWNIEHMYTNGPANGLAEALINYMGSSDAKDIAAKRSFVPIGDMDASALSTRTK